MLASEIMLESINSAKVMALIVAEGNKPVGIVMSTTCCGRAWRRPVDPG